MATPNLIGPTGSELTDHSRTDALKLALHALILVPSWRTHGHRKAIYPARSCSSLGHQLPDAETVDLQEKDSDRANGWRASPHSGKRSRSIPLSQRRKARSSRTASDVSTLERPESTCWTRH